VWRKSSRSGGGNNDACVEIAAIAGDTMAVRDSKNATGPMLTWQQASWQTFLRDVRGLTE
jgi:hypothetical protein